MVLVSDKRKPKINWCELAAQVVALHLWAKNYPKQSVRLWCDIIPAVQQLKKQSTSDECSYISALIRRVTKAAIKDKCHYWIDHIQGEDKDPADASSTCYENPFEGIERLHPGLLQKMKEKSDTCEAIFDLLFP